jgi:hypothetical protein
VKKILPAAVLTAFLLFLAACGSKPSGTVSASDGQASSVAKDNQPAGQTTIDQGRDAPLSGAARPDVAALLMTTSLPDLSGAVKPLAAHKGKDGILLAFVDTKCPFSNVAIRELPRVASVLETHGISSLLVNIGESEAAVKKTYASDVPVVYDTGKATQKGWNVHSVPTVVLLDSAGSIAYQGAAAWAKVATATENMLNLTAGSVLLDEAQSTIQG